MFPSSHIDKVSLSTERKNFYFKTYFHELGRSEKKKNV
jgi:hypothetical protein